GAMQNQMNTFRGVMSNLQDSWDQFLVSVADQGLLEAMKDIGKEFSAMLGGSDDLSVSLGQLLASSVRSIWELFKEVQPELRELILKFVEMTQNTGGAADAVELLLDIMGGMVDMSKSFIDGAGGMEGALWTLLPAITAVTIAMIGLVGLPGAI